MHTRHTLLLPPKCRYPTPTPVYAAPHPKSPLRGPKAPDWSVEAVTARGIVVQTARGNSRNVQSRSLTSSSQFRIIKNYWQ